MDLTAITRALDDVYRQHRHLPRPHDIAQRVLDAYHPPTPTPDNPQGLAGVVAALWPIGAAAGAQRGHQVTIDAIRALVAESLADPISDERGRWVVMGFVRATDLLPPTPDPARTNTATGAGQLTGHPQRLDQALTVGLGNSWRAAHQDAAERVLGRFGVILHDLIGHERLATTFLLAELPAYALLEEVAVLAYRAAERDREQPPPAPNRPGSPTNRPSAARAFGALSRLDPGRHNPTHPHPRPSQGPGRPGPGR